MVAGDRCDGCGCKQDQGLWTPWERTRWLWPHNLCAQFQSQPGTDKENVQVCCVDISCLRDDVAVVSHSLKTKKRKLDGRNETDVVFDLMTVSMKTPVIGVPWHLETRKHRLAGLHIMSAFPLWSKPLWLSRQPGVGGAGLLCPFEL